MYLSLEPGPSLQSHCNIRALAWKGNGPNDELTFDEHPYRVKEHEYYQQGWLAVGNEEGILGISATCRHDRTYIKPPRENFNMAAEHKCEIVGIRWNEPFQRLATFDVNGVVLVWALVRSRWSVELTNDRQVMIQDLTWSHDGTRALVCYADNHVLVGSHTGARHWGHEIRMPVPGGGGAGSSGLVGGSGVAGSTTGGLSATVTAAALAAGRETDPLVAKGCFVPDDTKILLATTHHMILSVSTSDGTLLEHFHLTSGVQSFVLPHALDISFFGHSCARFSMRADQRFINEHFVLAVGFRSGHLALRASNGAPLLEHVLPSSLTQLAPERSRPLLETGLNGMICEWSSSGTQVLACAGSFVLEDAHQVRVYSRTGRLLFTHALPSHIPSLPVSALTWGHADVRLFVAAGRRLYVFWCWPRARCIPPLEQLCLMALRRTIWSSRECPANAQPLMSVTPPPHRQLIRPFWAPSASPVPSFAIGAGLGDSGTPFRSLPNSPQLRRRRQLPQPGVVLRPSLMQWPLSTGQYANGDVLTRDSVLLGDKMDEQGWLSSGRLAVSPELVNQIPSALRDRSILLRLLIARLPISLRDQLARFLCPTIRAAFPDPRMRRAWALAYPAPGHRVHCTMKLFRDGAAVNNSGDGLTPQPAALTDGFSPQMNSTGGSSALASYSFVLYLERLGALIPLLRAKRSGTKLFTDFHVFDPPCSPVVCRSCAAHTDTFFYRRDSYLSFWKAYETAFTDLTRQWGRSNQDAKICVVRSNLVGTKYTVRAARRLACDSFRLPSQLLAVTYKPSVLHLRPRQLEIDLTILEPERCRRKTEPERSYEQLWRNHETYCCLHQQRQPIASAGPRQSWRSGNCRQPTSNGFSVVDGLSSSDDELEPWAAESSRSSRTQLNGPPLVHDSRPAMENGIHESPSRRQLMLLGTSFEDRAVQCDLVGSPQVVAPLNYAGSDDAPSSNKSTLNGQTPAEEVPSPAKKAKAVGSVGSSGKTSTSWRSRFSDWAHGLRVSAFRRHTSLGGRASGTAATGLSVGSTSQLSKSSALNPFRLSSLRYYHHEPMDESMTALLLDSPDSPPLSRCSPPPPTDELLSPPASAPPLRRSLHPGPPCNQSPLITTCASSSQTIGQPLASSSATPSTPHRRTTAFQPMAAVDPATSSCPNSPAAGAGRPAIRDTMRLRSAAAVQRTLDHNRQQVLMTPLRRKKRFTAGPSRESPLLQSAGPRQRRGQRPGTHVEGDRSTASALANHYDDDDKHMVDWLTDSDEDLRLEAELNNGYEGRYACNCEQHASAVSCRSSTGQRRFRGRSSNRSWSPPLRRIVLRNKAPVWNVQHEVYQLDFGGRVAQESAKNFKIEHDGRQVLQFGRVDASSYTLDFEHPFTPLQAMAVCLTNITQRMK